MRPQVFQQGGHTTERTIGERTARHFSGVVEPADDDRVQFRVDALDALDGGVEQLGRGHLPGAHKVGLGGGVKPASVIRK
jgi:hypothetical protein